MDSNYVGHCRVLIVVSESHSIIIWKISQSFIWDNCIINERDWFGLLQYLRCGHQQTLIGWDHSIINEAINWNCFVIGEAPLGWSLLLIMRKGRAISRNDCTLWICPANAVVGIKQRRRCPSELNLCSQALEWSSAQYTVTDLHSSDKSYNETMASKTCQSVWNTMGVKCIDRYLQWVCDGGTFHALPE